MTFFFTTIVTLAALLPQSAIAKHESSLCKAPEQIYFSCPMKNKTLSICQQGDNPSPEYLEYRFGRKGKIELSYRVESGQQHRKFFRSEIRYASNSSNAIWFRNNSATYVLHSPMRGGPLLQVLEQGELVAEMECNRGWKNVLGDPEASSSLISPGPSGLSSEVEKFLNRK